MFLKVPLGAEAIAYIRSQFFEDDPLIRGLRELPLESGRVFGVFPEHFQMEAPDDFERGDPFEYCETDGGGTILMEAIRAHTSSSSAILLFHSFACENDPPVTRLTVPYFAMGELRAMGRPICLCLSGDGVRDPEQIHNGFRWARPSQAIMQATVYPGAAPQSGQVMSDEECLFMSRNTSLLIVGAFGGDDCKLIWER
jgi:hypothetical protein